MATKSSKEKSFHDIDLSQSEYIDVDTYTPSQIHLFKSQIILNPTISITNFIAFVVFSLYIGLIGVPTRLLQFPLLTVVYGSSNSERINTVVILTCTQLVLQMAFFPYMASLCDTYGRRVFVVAGVIILNVATFILPNLPGVVPYFFIVSILQVIGLGCLVIPPLLADYIDHQTKGRVAGFVSTLSATASFISTSLLDDLDLQTDIPSAYHISAVVGLLIGIFIIYGLKGGVHHKDLYSFKRPKDYRADAIEMTQVRRLSELSNLIPSSKDQVQINTRNDYLHFEQKEIKQASQPILEPDTVDIKPGFTAGVREAQRNPWILTGYIATFLAHSLMILISSVYVNYVPVLTGNNEDTSQAYTLINRKILIQIFSGLFFGFFTDTYNKFKILAFIIACSIIGVILLLIAPTPYNFLAYLAMVFLGISLGGFTVYVDQVTSKYPDPKYRASVGAVSGMCAGLGASMTSIIGMFFSKFSPVVPFYLHLVATVCGVGSLCYIFIYKKDMLKEI